MALIGFGLLTANLASAQVLEYEGFDYASTTLVGGSGGTGWGVNVWVDTNSDMFLSNDGVSLAFPPSVSHIPAGGRIVLAAAGDAERRLGTSINLSNEANTVYFSALVKRQGTIRFEFMDNGNNVRWRFGGQGDSSTNAAVLGVANDVYFPNVFPCGETVYIVAKMVAHQPANDTVYMNIYRATDIVPSSEPTSWQISANSASAVTLTRLQIRNASATAAEVDEIRLGTTFASVAGGVAAGPPLFTRQPVGAAIYQGLDVLFSADVSGAVPMSFQWLLNDNPVGGAISNILSLTNVQATQVGTYTLRASNSVAVVTSAPAVLQLIEVTNISVGRQALWHFDETNGLVAYDATTNHNDGALLGYAGNNSQWVPSDYNGALAFSSAISNAVQVPNSASVGVNLANRFSVATWFKSAVPLSVNGNQYRILEKENSFFLLQGDGNTNNGVGNGGMNLLVKKSGANLPVSIGQALEANRWYHIVGTFDGAKISIYLDGELKDTRAVAAPLDNPGLPLRIGSDYTATVTGMKYLNGAMDEVGIWDRALKLSEVQELSGAYGIARILDQPQSQSTYVGGSAVLRVRARGQMPLRYLWYKGTNEIRTAITNVLSFYNLQPEDAGDYQCRVANDLGDTFTDVATLTVRSATNINELAEARWTFNETTGLVAADASNLGRSGQLVDFVGNDGQWGSGVSDGALYFDGQTNRVVSTNGSALVLGRDTTFAFWLRPTSYGSPVPASSWIYNDSRILRKGSYFDIELVDDPGSVRATLRANGIPAPLQNIVRLNEWQHFAVVFSGGYVSFYKNGFAVGDPVAGNLGATNTSAIVLGNTTDTMAATNMYMGAMDEVGIWGRRLSDTEILELANRSITGPPVIVTQPQSATRYVGGMVTFAVEATGVRPLSYQWLRNSVPIADSNTNRLVLTNLTLEAAGDYVVMVQNSASASVSSNATLTLQQIDGITTGLIAYWTFDETSGTVFQDASGHGHAATLRNAEVVPGTVGVVGGSFSFDGADDFAVVPHAADLNLSGQASFSVWVNPRTLVVTGDRQRILRKDINYDYALNSIGSRFMVYGMNKTELQAPVNTVTTNEWQHLVVVMKDGTVQFFKNGRALSDPFPGLMGPAVTNDLIIGNFAADMVINRLFKGNMDDLGVWNRALSPTEIDGIYQNGLVGKPLVAPYEPFAIRRVDFPTPGQVRLVYFSPYAGRQHVVERLDDSLSTNWTQQTPVAFNALPGGSNEVVFNQAAGAAAFYRLGVLGQSAIFSEDFETGAVNWTHGGSGDNWQVGVPVNGPGAAVSGTNVYATSLTGNIEAYSDSYLRSPPIALTGVSRATLTFKQWRNVDPDPTFHGTIVNILDATTLQVLQQLSLESGATTGYQTRTLPLPPQLLGRNVILEFRLYCDGFNLLEGWYLDDVKILPE